MHPVSHGVGGGEELIARTVVAAIRAWQGSRFVFDSLPLRLLERNPSGCSCYRCCLARPNSGHYASAAVKDFMGTGSPPAPHTHTTCHPKTS